LRKIRKLSRTTKKAKRTAFTFSGGTGHGQVKRQSQSAEGGGDAEERVGELDLNFGVRAT